MDCGESWFVISSAISYITLVGRAWASFVSQQVLQTPFADLDKGNIVDAMTKGNAKVRRKQQSAMNFANYLTKAEWTSIGQKYIDRADPDVQSIASIFVDVVFTRCDIINPTEPTMKMVSSSSMAACCDMHPEMLSQPLSDKVNVLTFVKKRFSAKYRKLNTQPFEYVEDLPENPNDLKTIAPKLHARIMHDLNGIVTASKLKGNHVMSIDNSYQCRNNLPKVDQLALIPNNGTPMQAMMAMLSQVFNHGAPLPAMMPPVDQRLKLTMSGLAKQRDLRGRKCDSNLRALMDGEESDVETPPGRSVLNRARTVIDNESTSEARSRSPRGFRQLDRSSNRLALERSPQARRPCQRLALEGSPRVPSRALAFEDSPALRPKRLALEGSPARRPKQWALEDSPQVQSRERSMEIADVPEAAQLWAPIF